MRHHLHIEKDKGIVPSITEKITSCIGKQGTRFCRIPLIKENGVASTKLENSFKIRGSRLFNDLPDNLETQKKLVFPSDIQAKAGQLLKIGSTRKPLFIVHSIGLVTGYHGRQFQFINPSKNQRSQQRRGEIPTQTLHKVSQSIP